LQFSAIARWIIDPAEPANFTRKLATKKFLIQEVVGDLVIPNLTTEREAALTRTPIFEAACAPPIPPEIPPSPAIVMSPTANKLVQYRNLPAGTCSARGEPEAFPGNTYVHGSLIRPAPGPAGQLGTARLQTDAITYLLLNP
jgi:hypothetical protein